MKSILAIVIGASLACCAIEASAEEPTIQKVQLDIARQSLNDALNAWAEQTGFQLVCLAPEIARDLVAPKVKGAFAAMSALEQLLSGTPLVYELTSERTVTVRTRFTAASTSNNGEYERRPKIQIARLARAETTTPRLAAANDQGTEPRTQSARALAGRKSEELEEIIVTGSRLQRAGEAAAPIVTFDRKKLDQLGISSLPEVLSYLPQQPFNYSSGHNIGGAQFAQLRGLGVDTTLVLINGRRTGPSALNAAANAFDLGTIPLAAVERVDILSDSASAVYGADAVGGVLNIVLKSRVSEPVVDLHYGASSGGADERRASFTGGYGNDRLQGMLILDYMEVGELLGRERERWRDQDYRRFGGTDQRSPNTNPGNITSLFPGNLPGLSSPIAAVPQGSSGVGLTPDDFVATAGERNLESLLQYQSIVPESERRGAALSAQFELLPELELFGDGLYSYKYTEMQFEPSTLPGLPVFSNPFNPFVVPVLVNYQFADLGPRHQISESELGRGVLGVRGELGSWSWEISGLHSNETSAIWSENAISFEAAFAALNATNPDQALNVFADGPGASASLLATLVAPPNKIRIKSESTQSTAFVRGPLFAMPAGDLRTAIGGEWRKESIESENAPGANRKVSAAFAELSVPLVDSTMQLPAVRDLEISIAGRYDHYDDFGSTFNPQYGVLWHPVADLLLRASFGSSFRPPSLFELHGAPITSPGVPVVDPRRGNELAFVDATFGGTPTLDPIKSDSLTTGFVFTPARLPSIRLAASYWKVSLRDRVAFFFPQLVLENEGQFPERVVRADPAPADIAAGLPGRVLSVDSRRINFGHLDAAGLDTELSYALDTAVGDFSFALSATRVMKHEADEAPNTPPVERVGIASLNGSIPKWRGFAALGWSNRGIGISTNLRYTGRYSDADAAGDPTGRSVPSQLVLDLQGSFAFETLRGSTNNLLAGLVARAGVFNAFDKEPEYAEIGTNFGFDRSQGDLRQRFFYVNLSKSF